MLKIPRFNTDNLHLWCLYDYYRTNAFESWIRENVQDKVVCDLGAGTGILLWLAYRNGAKRVIGIEKESQTLEILRDRFKDIPEIEIIEGDIHEMDYPESDIYLQENIGAQFIQEGIDLLFENCKRQGVIDKLYPNRFKILEGIHERATYIKVNSDEHFMEGSREFFKKYNLIPNSELLDNQTEVLYTRHEGHISEFEVEMLKRDVEKEERHGVELFNLLWEMSFDGNYVLSNYLTPSHWKTSWGFLSDGST